MRKSSDIKKLFILVILILIAAVVGLVAFIANVNVVTNTGEETPQETQPEKTSYEQIEVNNIITSIRNEQATFKLYDSNGSYAVELEDGTVNFSIIDKDKFEKEYPDSKLKSDSGVIATHDYKIKDVFIGVVNGEEYVIVITGDGKIGSMNVKEAVNKNVLRIKNELQEFEQKIAFIQKVTISDGTNDMQSTLAVAIDGTIYDLSAFLTK